MPKPTYYTPRGFEQDDKTPLIGLGCYLVGMHSILNVAAAREYHIRAIVWSLANQPDFLDLSGDDIVRHIGIRTEAQSLTRPMFFRRVNERLLQDAVAHSIYRDHPIHKIIP